MKYLFLLLLTGCSTCDWVFDIGPGRGYCYAGKACDKLCKDHGGRIPSNPPSPVRFMCADGTIFKGYGKEWKQAESWID